MLGSVDLVPWAGRGRTCVNGPVFICATLELSLPAATAVMRLHTVLRSRDLEELSQQAYQAGLHTLSRVGPFNGAPVLSMTVRLQMLEPRSVDNGVRVPLRWVATGASGHLFPTLDFPALDADLDITATDQQRCALSINAIYTPPLGAADAHLDQLLLRPAARATMRSLLRGVGRSLANPPPAAATRAGARQLGTVTFLESPDRHTRGVTGGNLTTT